MGSGQYCWDKLNLVLQENHSVTAILRLKDRRSAIDIYQQLINANFSDNTGDLTINIDNNEYTFPYLQWQSMLLCFEKWFELYANAVLN